jgi:Ca-activated chloride channel family protein
LTLLKTGTYTDPVTTPGRASGLILVLSFAILGRAEPRAQAIERSLYVSVLDEAGAPVPNLGPSDFVVREDNAAREVLRVAPADEPMQIAVLVDTSEAARSSVQDMRRALEIFVRDITSGTEPGVRNQISIVGTGERPTILADSSSDPARLMKGVNRIFTQRQTGNYLLEAILEVSKGFSKREARRSVIVALTSEGPEYSNRRWEDVLEPLKANGTAFHAIVLGPPAVDIGEDTRNRSAVLDQGPEVSGGRRDRLLASSALPGVLKQLAEELKHQYLVTYARPQSLIPPERTTVATKRPGLTTRGTPVKEAKDARKPGQT